MNSKRHYGLWLVLAAMAMVGLVFLTSSSLAKSEDSEKTMKSQMCTDKPGCQMCKMCMHRLQTMAKLKAVLDEAKQSAEDEKAKKTLAKIGEAQELLEQQHKKMHEQMGMHMKKMHMGMCCPMCSQTMDKSGKAGMKCPMCGKMICAKKDMVCNSLCPMTGNKIDPEKVPAELTRMWKGKKVGFCCAGCPAQWDKLSDKQKQKKLDAGIEPAEDK